ncbi:MAG TPA: hypothetical protein VF733_05890 [Candidatus Saccharimonadales bacterium]
MDSLQDIMAKFGRPEQPELVAIKRYIDDHYKTPVSTAINGESIIISVPSAALANTLRLQTSKIQAACNTTKRLVFRIG